MSGPAMEMLGLSETLDEGTTAPRWNPEERALLDEKLATRRPFLDFVYSRVNSDGSEQFLQTSGEPKFDAAGRFIGYRGIGMDVTGRMRAGGDAQCRDELQRLRSSIFEQLTAGAGAVGTSAVQLLRTDGSLVPVEIHRQAGAVESGWMLVEVIPDKQP